MVCPKAVYEYMTSPAQVPVIQAFSELALYIILCISIIIRYRHHILYSSYRNAPKPHSPRAPVEAMILISMSTYLFFKNVLNISKAVAASSQADPTGGATQTFDDIPSALLFLLIAFLDWREESQFSAHVASYSTQKSAALAAANAPAPAPAPSVAISVADEKGQLCIVEQCDPEPAAPAEEELSGWAAADAKPPPTATNIHVQYQLRCSLKALLAYAALIISQLDLARPVVIAAATAAGVEIPPEPASSWAVASAVWGVPLALALGGVYLARAAVLLVQTWVFGRREFGVKL